MSANAGVDIIENGLVLFIDAGNRRCYPGTGTTMFDLSPSGRNGTLVSSTQYNSAGYIQYAGALVNTETSVTSVPINTSAGNTVEQWIYLDAAQANGSMPFTWGTNSLNLWAYNDTFGINNSSSLIYGISSANSILIGKWCHVVVYFPYNWSASYTSSKMWLNGVSRTMAIQAGSLANVTLSSLQDVNIGGGYSGIDDYNWNGRIAITKIYNRELSTAEAQQNFNALRSRFGI